MSIASFNQFQNDVMQDSALQEQFKTTEATSPESLGELAVKLGADRGYNFTLEEIQAAADQELSDAELESVAGGILPFLAPIAAIGSAKLATIFGGVGAASGIGSFAGTIAGLIKKK